jgi:hypothetical protein
LCIISIVKNFVGSILNLWVDDDGRFYVRDDIVSCLLNDCAESFRPIFKDLIMIAVRDDGFRVRWHGIVLTIEKSQRSRLLIRVGFLDFIT